MGFARSVREAASSRAGDQRARSAGGDRDDRLAVKLFRAKTRRREEEGRTVRPPYSGKRSASRGGLTGKAASRQTRHLRVFARNNQHRSEEHTSELLSLMRLPYPVFCLHKKNKSQAARGRSEQSHA